MLKVIFWKEPSHVASPVDIVFPPHLLGDTYEFLKNRMPAKALSENVQRFVIQKIYKLSIDYIVQQRIFLCVSIDFCL